MATDYSCGTSLGSATDKAQLSQRALDRWQVVMLNDDYTPFPWVIDVLITIFERTPTDAEKVTMSVHREGKGIAGVYPRKKAIQLAARCVAKARREGYPFTCMAVPVDDGDQPTNNLLIRKKIMNFRLQDSIARVAYAAQTSSLAHDRADLMPMVFMVLLCQNESTKEALHSAGLHGGILPSLLKNALLDLDDIRAIVNEANTLTYDPQFEEEVFENPTILSWIANAAIHVMSVGRHSGVIDVYDLLVVLRTQMREGSSMARLWDAGGLTLLALRQHDAYLHGKGGVFTLAPPATTEWLADFLDETLCLDEEDDDAEASLEHDAEPEADLDVAETSEQSDDTIEQSDEKAKEEKPTDSVTPVSQKPTSHKPVVEEVSLEDLPPELQPRAENMRVMRINLDASQGDEAANAAMEAIRQLFVDQIRQVNDRLNGEEGGDGSDVMSDERTDDEATAKKQPLSREEKFLRSCTRNLSAEAEAGQIDPLIGRDDEVTRICEILCCRRKNKPLILGESGSGKTALVEGLALRIVRGEVPPALRDVRLYALNASSLVSRFKGAFAEKLSEIAAVLKKVPNAVLFIDNLHMLINGNDGNSQEEYNAAFYRDNNFPSLASNV